MNNMISSIVSTYSKYDLSMLLITIIEIIHKNFRSQWFFAMTFVPFRFEIKSRTSIRKL